ncbi:hypothetical protein CLOM_g4121 [Closterium sp. NIES-68]|nr:hypothetical protein CLOM_g4121 [Closterium sp. NIES-68]
MGGDSPEPAPGPAGELECAVNGGSGAEALSWRVGGMFGILVCSIIGFALPYLLRKQHRTVLFFFRTFAAGVVLAVAIVHIFPGAQEALSNPCLGFAEEFPWASIFVLYAALISFVVECYLKKVLLKTLQSNNAKNHAPAEGECVECGLNTEEDEKALVVSGYRATSYTLEAGIVFHSIFIGIALGTTQDIEEIQSLVIALMFHQGFEGISLGTTLIPCQFSKLKTVIMGLLFALTTPLGVVIGLAIYSSYNPASKAALATEGAFNAISAGILIYNGLVDLVVPAFDETDESTPKAAVPYFLGFVSLFLGAFSMCLLALWA